MVYLLIVVVAFLAGCGITGGGATALPPTIFVTESVRLLGVSDMQGTTWWQLGTAGSDIGEFRTPNHVVRDSAGRFYISDGNRLVRFDDLTGRNWIALSGFGCAYGVAFDAAGRIYIADRCGYRVVRIDNMTGAGWTSYGSCCVGVGRFWEPTDVAVDAQGRIYLADMMNERIVRIDDMNGTGWTEFGSGGGGPGQLHWPWGVALDSSGRIYIADSANGRVVRVDDMNGTNWITDANFGQPWGVHVTASGRIYAADRNDNKIVRMENMSGGGRVILRCGPAPTDPCFNGPISVWGP